jgi:hypothetical protein
MAPSRWVNPIAAVLVSRRETQKRKRERTEAVLEQGALFRVACPSFTTGSPQCAPTAETGIQTKDRVGMGTLPIFGQGSVPLIPIPRLALAGWIDDSDVPKPPALTAAVGVVIGLESEVRGGARGVPDQTMKDEK